MRPQNTLPSFELALKNKLPMIELDTQLAKTGEVVVFHDDKVDEITRGQAHGAINSFSFDELQAINVHDGFNDGTYQIPALEEVLDLVDKYADESSRTKVNIELKGSGTAEPVVAIIKKYQKKGWQLSDFVVSSFKHHELEKFKQLMPEVDVAVLLNQEQWKALGSAQAAIDLGKKLRAEAINPDVSFTTSDFVKAAHENGFEVNVYVVNEPEDILRMRNIGADRIFTDNFVTARKVLASQ